MSQEVSKWLVSYNPLTNHLLNSWDILVPLFLLGGSIAFCREIASNLTNILFTWAAQPPTVVTRDLVKLLDALGIQNK